MGADVEFVRVVSDKKSAPGVSPKLELPHEIEAWAGERAADKEAPAPIEAFIKFVDEHKASAPSPVVSWSKIREQIEDANSDLAPLFAKEAVPEGGMRLDSVEIDLALSAEGDFGVLPLSAKVQGGTTVKLTFARPKPTK